MELAISEFRDKKKSKPSSLLFQSKREGIMDVVMGRQFLVKCQDVLARGLMAQGTAGLDDIRQRQRRLS